MTRASREVSDHAFPTRAFWWLYAAAAAGLAVLALVAAPTTRYADERQYWEIAQHLTHGRGFSLEGTPTAFRPPVWVLALTPAAALTPAIRYGALVSVGALALAGVVAARLCARLSGSPLGLLAGLLILLHPLNAYASWTLYPQVAALALVAILWSFGHRLLDEHSVTTTGLVGFGLAAGLVVLTAPNLAGSAVLACFLLWWAMRGQRLRVLLVAGGSALLPLAAWTVRNAIVLHAFVPVATSGGINLLLGNCETATASSGTAADISAYTSQAATLQLDEMARNRFYRAAAWDWITASPGAALLLYLGKMANYFAAYNAPTTATKGGGLQAIVAWGCLLVLLALTVARVVIRRPWLPALHASERLMLAVWVLSAPMMAVFFTRPRFRLPLDAVLLVEAAVLIASWLAHRRATKPAAT